MKSPFATLFFLAAITASAQTTQPENGQPEPRGTIMGVVTNNDGDPIERASLCTSYATPTGSGTSCGGTETDKNGKFELRVPLGDIGIFAQKNEGGYWPVVEDSPSHSRGIHKLKLTAEAPTATVTLKIGPRPGELKFDVKDKSTGRPIKGFAVRWIAMDNDRMMSIDMPLSRTLIPPGIDVIVEVHAAGYRRWFYIDPSDPSQPILRLAPGEEKHVEVELEPVEKN